jgi:hypothetical protein
MSQRKFIKLRWTMSFQVASTFHHRVEFAFLDIVNFTATQVIQFVAKMICLKAHLQRICRDSMKLNDKCGAIRGEDRTQGEESTIGNGTTIIANL